MSQGMDSSREPVTTAKGSLREVQRRRSERLLITIPIRVNGVDRFGKEFQESARTLVVNRHGARILLKQSVAAGTQLLITTAGGRRSAKFRVVGPIQPPTEEGGEWGIECLESNSNLWGIEFPPATRSDNECAALLECARCHTVKLLRLSMVEHEVLGNSGLLVRDCVACSRPTSWTFRDPAAQPFPEWAEPAPAVAAGNAGLPAASPRGDEAAALFRGNERVALQLPIRLRSFSGKEEFSRTENVSRGGLCFIGEGNYEIGEVILITCPYEKDRQNTEVRGQVVRRREIQGSGRKIYGVSYEK